MIDYNTSYIRFSGSDLKLMACMSMLVDHLALCLHVTGIPDLIFRQIIGRLAFPIFSFLLVEGFLHTRNRLQYLGNLLLFACLSEIPFDLVIMEHTSLVPELTRQNTLFTLSLGLVLLICMKKAEDLPFCRTSAVNLMLCQLGCILALGAVSSLLHLDYGIFGIACIGGMYLFRPDPVQSVVAGCVCLNLDLLSMPGAFLAAFPISRYNRTRGKQMKYFFYLFYPLHLVVLYLLFRVLPLR